MAETQDWDEDADRKFDELFETLDTDGSGSLTFDEIKNGGLEQGATTLGNNPSDEEVTQFIETLDKDGDSAVSKEEFKTFLQDFIAMIKEHMGQQQEDEEPAEGSEFVWDENKFEAVFEYLDEDSSNVLTFNEIQNGSLRKAAQILDRNPTDDEVQQFLDELHSDADGEITKDEFRVYLKDFMEKINGDPNAVLKAAVDDMMAAIDTDGNGFCTKDEFKAFLQDNGRAPLSDEEVDELFVDINTDDDTSTLSKEDLLQLLLIEIAQN